MIAVALAMVACSATKDEPPRNGRGTEAASRTESERHVEAVSRGAGHVAMRTGPQVPIALPSGFTLCPGGKIEASTMVERKARRHVLIEFTCPDPPRETIALFRRQVDAAGVKLALDLSGSESASLGGTLANGQTISISARRETRGSEVVIAID